MVYGGLIQADLIKIEKMHFLDPARIPRRIYRVIHSRYECLLFQITGNKFLEPSRLRAIKNLVRGSVFLNPAFI